MLSGSSTSNLLTNGSLLNWSPYQEAYQLGCRKNNHFAFKLLSNSHFMTRSASCECAGDIIGSTYYFCRCGVKVWLWLCVWDGWTCQTQKFLPLFPRTLSPPPPLAVRLIACEYLSSVCHVDITALIVYLFLETQVSGAIYCIYLLLHSYFLCLIILGCNFNLYDLVRILIGTFLSVYIVKWMESDVIVR